MNSKVKYCLLVEDDPEDQEFFIDALHSISSTTGCYAVLNGEEALLTLAQEQFTPDYIFTDINTIKIGISCQHPSWIKQFTIGKTPSPKSRFEFLCKI